MICSDCHPNLVPRLSTEAMCIVCTYVCFYLCEDREILIEGSVCGSVWGLGVGGLRVCLLTCAVVGCVTVNMCCSGV